MRDDLAKYMKRAENEQALLNPDEVESLLNDFEENPNEWQKIFCDVEKFVLFIGHPRSGHSLIGGILDAHPEVIIAHELGVLELLEGRSLEREAIYRLILRNSEVAAQIRRTWGSYRYEVPGMWQGRYTKLRIIGDKRGGRTARNLREDENNWDTLQKVFGSEVTFLNTVRNPLDNIATIAIKHRLSVDHATQMYFENCQTISAVEDRVSKMHFYRLYAEDFIGAPGPEISRLFAFLGLSLPPSFLDVCASVVKAQVNPARKKVAWTQPQLKQIESSVQQFHFLKKYLTDLSPE